MTRTILASAGLLVVLLGSTGCYRYRYHGRYGYVVPGPAVRVIAVSSEVYEPLPAPEPPPPAPPKPRTVVVHAPPGSLVVVNPRDPTPAQPNAPAPAPQVEPQPNDPGWFDNE